jgi:hypothetical protein
MSCQCVKDILFNKLAGPLFYVLSVDVMLLC